jgi:hypothetical protein
MVVILPKIMSVKHRLNSKEINLTFKLLTLKVQHLKRLDNMGRESVAI